MVETDSAFDPRVNTNEISHMGMTATGPALIVAGGILSVGAGIAFCGMIGAVAVGAVAIEGVAGGGIVYGVIASSFGFAAGTGLVGLGSFDVATSAIGGARPRERQNLLQSAEKLEQLGSIEKFFLGTFAKEVSEAVEPGSGHMTQVVADLLYDGVSVGRLGLRASLKKPQSVLENNSLVFESLEVDRDIQRDAAKLFSDKTKSGTREIKKAEKPDFGGKLPSDRP